MSTQFYTQDQPATSQPGTRRAQRHRHHPGQKIPGEHIFTQPWPPDRPCPGPSNATGGSQCPTT